MKPVQPAAWAAALLLALLAGQAGAVAVAGPGGTADQGRRLVPDAPAGSTTTGTLDLLAARLDAVDLAAGAVTVRGQRVLLHATALRVLGRGGQVLGPRSLRAGQSVRLALDAGTPGPATSPASAPLGPLANPPAPARRIVLIYIDE